MIVEDSTGTQNPSPDTSQAENKKLLPPVQSSNCFVAPDHCWHKNRLQEYTQKCAIPFPVYQTKNEGTQHAPQFRSTVLVDGLHYTSQSTFPHRKAAEQDVAKVALLAVSQKGKDEGCSLIREDTFFCKSVLNEYVMKLNLERLAYTTTQSGGSVLAFVSSLVFKGVTYSGDPAKSKKEAEQLAARAVILSMLDSESGTVLSEIIKSKKPYAALHSVKSSQHSQDGVKPAGASTGNGPGASLGKEKDDEVAANTVSEPTLAKHASVVATTCFPFPVEQHQIVASTFGRKQTRKSKKGKKKRRVDTQLAVAVMPVNQLRPFCDPMLG